MKNKVLTIALAVALAISLALPVSAAGAEFVVTKPEYAPKAGESFDVTLEIKNNPGFWVFQFSLTYDERRAECTEVEAGSLVDNTLYVTNPAGPYGGALISGATVSPVTGDGVIAVFHFTAKRDLRVDEFGCSKIGIGDEDGNWIDIRVSGLESMKIEQSDKDEPVQPSDPIDPIMFSDVEGHWAEEYILKAAELGLFNGYGDGRFGPDDPVKRGQFIAVLYRLAGSPSVSLETPFTDIGDQLPEFQTAIAWGYSRGYINGTSATTFSPENNITTQEALKILFAYTGGVSGVESMFTGIYDKSYLDSGDIAEWAKPAMYWGVYNEIISGTSSSTLSPLQSASRAQLAKILVRYLDKF